VGKIRLETCRQRAQSRDGTGERMRRQFSSRRRIPLTPPAPSGTLSPRNTAPPLSGAFFDRRE
jgi:hypothetical protein